MRKQINARAANAVWARRHEQIRVSKGKVTWQDCERVRLSIQRAIRDGLRRSL